MHDNVAIFFAAKYRSVLVTTPIFSVLIQIFIMIVGLSINKLISINFGVESYSTYSVFKNLSAVISFTMLSGMGIALPKFLAVCKSKKKSVFFR